MFLWHCFYFLSQAQHIVGNISVVNFNSFRFAYGLSFITNFLHIVMTAMVLEGRLKNIRIIIDAILFIDNVNMNYPHVKILANTFYKDQPM